MASTAELLHTSPTTAEINCRTKKTYGWKKSANPLPIPIAGLERNLAPKCVVHGGVKFSKPLQARSNQLNALIFASWVLTISLYTADRDVRCHVYNSGKTVLAKLQVDETLTAQAFVRLAQDELMQKSGSSDLHSIRLEQNGTGIYSTFGNIFVEYTATEEEEDGLRGRQDVEITLRFDPTLVDARFAQRVVATLTHIMPVLAESGSTSLSSLDLVSPRDRSDLETMAYTSAPTTVEATVHNLIAAQVNKRPSSMAIHAWDGTISYRQLDSLASDVARTLTARGVGRGQAVPILFEKTKWAVVGILGVWKAGAYYVPLDPSHPQERLEHIIHAVGATTMLCGNKTRRQAEKLESDVLVLPLRDEPPNKVVSDTNPRDMVDSWSRKAYARPTDLAYTIFTSGSTGTPKGVMMEHISLSSSLMAMGQFLNLYGGARVPQLASLTFDISVFEIASTLVFGGCVCVPSEEQKMNDLAGFMREFRVNILASTPSMSRSLSRDSVPSLTSVLLGGEPMLQSDKDQWSGPNLPLMNVYGPTETCIACSLQSITPSTAPDAIGSSPTLSCCRLWIVDPQNEKRLAPIGAVGELCVEGPNVARGYLDDMEQTKRAFVERPAWLRPGDKAYRMYKTGDMVRLHPDGTLRYVGRKDSQVKVRGGYRVELCEIEDAIMKNTPDWITAAVELVVPSGTGRSLLVAAVAVRRDFHIPGGLETRRAMLEMVALLRPRLERILPSYMLPDGYVPLHNLPVNSSGKLDRKTLRDTISTISLETIVSCATETHRDDDEPLVGHPNEYLELLRHICANVLNIAPEGIVLDRSFVRNGGDSIAAMQVVARYREAGKAIKISELLRTSSLRDVADAVRELRLEDRQMPQEQPGRRFKLSPIQQVLMDIAPSPQEWNHYNQSFLMRLAVCKSEQVLEGAMAWLVERHSMLRARFEQTPSGQWMQYIDPAPAIPYVLNMHGKVVPTKERTKLIDFSRKRLDISHGPLVRVDVFDDADSQLLFIAIHHLVVDLVSWRIMIDELQQIFAAPNRPPHELEPPFSFQAWAEAQERHFVELTLGDPLKVLPVHAPFPNFDFWGIDPANNLHRNACSKKLSLSPVLTRNVLQDHHDPLRTEPIDILLAALVLSFKHTFPERDIPTIMNESHGRETWHDGIDLSRTVGWFTTLYPIYAAKICADQIVDAVKRIKDARKSIPSNGWEYFGCRALTDHGQESFGRHLPAEMAFNYEGSYSLIEQEDSILREEQWSAGEDLADASPTLPRLTLFEISSNMLCERLHFTFVWHSAMLHQDRISEWINSIPETLNKICTALASEATQLTRSDVPLVDAEYPALTALTQRVLALPGVSNLEDIEEIYPCSPMQKSLAISQARHEGVYESEMVWEVRETTGRPVDPARLAVAWEQTVARHSALRTAFVEGTGENSVFEQVVLRTHKPQCLLLHDVVAAETALNHPRRENKDDMGYPQHRMLICSSDDGATFCRLEVTHLICDGMSIPPLLRDLSLAYEGTLDVRHGPRYSDFVRYICDKERYSDSIMHWTKRLRNTDPCLFPAMLDTVPMQNEQRELNLHLNIDYSTLQSALSREGLTLPTLFQMAWALMLQHYTGKSKVVFGHIIAGRDAPLENVEDIVGPLIGVLITHVDFSTNALAVEIMRYIQDDCLEGFAKQACSLADIHHALDLQEGALSTRALLFSRHQLNLAQHSASIRSYARILTMRVAGTVRHIVAELVHDLNRSPSDIPTLSPEDGTDIWRWNEHLIEAAEECAHHAIESSMRKHPQRLALCGWDGKISYGELEDLTHRLAIKLMSAGVGPDRVVPICYRKSNWAIVAMLAVLRAGGCFVMLDPGHPDSRIIAIIDEVDAPVVISSENECARIERSGRPVLSLTAKTAAELPPGDLDMIPCTTVTPDDAMYVIFTSGTTGVPKGVVITHRAFSSGFGEHVRAMCLSAETRTLQFAAYSFDASIIDVMCTLKVGGCLCTPSEADRGDIAPFVARSGANWAGWTPSFAALVDPRTVPTLEVLVVAGEPLPRALVDAWAGSVKLLNVYGPSECSVACTVNHVTGSRSVDPANVGRAYRAATWIVDENDHERLRPVGAVGELLIEGPALARGYLNRRDATAKSFISSPSWLRARRPNSRLYKTGDLARYSPDGSIIFVGRKDSQLKINGQRVEIGDIEHHLRENLPAPAPPVAVELLKRGTTHMLAAFIVVASPEHRQSDAEDIIADDHVALAAFRKLVQQLRDSPLSLPAYMTPRVFVPLKKLPTTTSGKLDRSLIQHVTARLSSDVLFSFAASADHTEDAEDYTPEERTLLALWKENLGISKAGVYDNFFSLGGDSLLAIRLSTAARKQGLDLPVAAIFKNPIAFNMAKCLARTVPPDVRATVKPMSLLRGFEDQEMLLPAVAAECVVTVDSIEDIFPCTPFQESLMALSAREDGLQQPYVTHAPFRLPKGVDESRFRAAWDTVCAQHGMLRARIVLRPHGALLVVVNTPVQVETLNIPCDQYLEQQKQTPFDYGRPLLRLAVTADGHFVLSSHHACYDGWSLSIVWDAVARAYRGEFPSPGPPFQAFVQHAYSSASMVESEQFWKQALADKDEDSSTVSIFPTCPAGHRPIARQKRVHNIKAPRRPTYRPNVTMSSLITAAWAVVIAQYGGSSKATFGATVSGRDLPLQGIERVVGPTLATIPRRVAVQSDQSVADFLHYVHEDVVVASMPHSRLALSRIMRLSSAARQVGGFQSTLTVHPRETVRVSAHEALGLDALPVDTQSFHPYPLVLDCWLDDDKDDSVSFEAHFDSTCLSDDTVASILRHVSHVLHGLCSADPADPVASIATPCTEDLTNIVQWASRVPPAMEACTLHAIEANSAQHPHREALAAKEKTWSYGELNEQAEQLARQLTHTGLVGPDRFVGICFEKSGFAVVAMLAIWKAGGAYVPLDPAYPPARLLSLIQRAEVQLVLTSAATKDIFGDISKNELTTICAEDEFLAIEQNAGPLHLPVISPHHAAYMIFTSGSTGEPKGVVVDHRALSSSIRSMDATVPLDSKVRMLQYASFTFDLSVQEIFHTLSTGGCICMPSDSQRMDELGNFINANRVTAVSLTPSVLRLLRPTDIPAVNIIICGGEPLTQGDVTTWAGAEGLRFVNEYGPTEVCISVARMIMKPDTKANVIGRSVAMAAWIVSPTTGTLAPVGAVGELYLQGSNMARGYHGDTERTAAAFLHDPAWLPANHSGRVYRSGDMACYNADGTLSFLGRRDGQIKIRGQRVETGEVAEWVRKCMVECRLPFSNAAVLFYRPPVLVHRRACEPFLVALLELEGLSGPVVMHHGDVEKNDLTRDALQLKRMLRSVLAGHMVPVAYVTVAELPKTTSGKLNDRLVHEWLEELERNGSPLIGPRGGENSTRTAHQLTENEDVLRQCWAEVLELDSHEVGSADEFFDLGGSSVTAIRLVSQMRARGYRLKFVDIVAQQRLDEMALCLRSEEDEDEKEESHDLPNAPGAFELLEPTQRDIILQELLPRHGIDVALVEDVYPCTPFQESLIAATARSREAYMSFHSLELPSNMDDTQMQDIWNAVAARFELLRTRIVPGIGNGPALQVVMRSSPPWHRVAVANAVVAAVQVGSWDGGPLAHMAWISPRRAVLVLHHALYDGWSFSIIWRAIAARITGKEVPPLSPTPFSAFVRRLTQQNHKSSASYWQSRLNGTDYPGLPLVNHTVGYQPAATRNAKRSAHLVSMTASGGSATALVHAAWGLTLAHFTASEDVVFTGIMSGRETGGPSLLAVVGPTMAAVPVRVQLHPTTTVHTLLDRVAHDTSADLEHAHFGINRISRVSDDARRACASDSLVVVQPPPDDDHDDTRNPSRLRLQPLNTSQAFLPHALVVEVELARASSRMALSLAYDPQLLSPTLAEGVLSTFTTLLTRLSDTTNSRIPLRSLPAASPMDMAVLRAHARPPVGIDSCAHHLLRTPTIDTPEALAVDSWDGRLTYTDLDARSSRLAARLVSHGVRPDCPIPLLLGKTKDVPVAMLAVWKAGSFWIPIDVAWPKARKQTILESVDAAAILVSRQTAAMGMELLTDARPLVVVDENDEKNHDNFDSLPRQQQFQPDPSSLAYVMFTSGSTGTPKGVMVPHRALSSALIALRASHGIDASSRVLHQASFTFDLALAEIFIVLCAGGTVCIPSDAACLDDLPGFARTANITNIFCTPSLSRLLDPDELPALRGLHLGGEPMLDADKQRWCGRVCLTNGFGPTEACIATAVNPVVSVKSSAREMGRGLQNCRLWIAAPLSNGDRLAPMGAVGELYIEGPSVATGYLGDSKATSQVFSNGLPGTWFDAEKWKEEHGPYSVYRTGDLARYDEHGCIHFVGRKDALQVKLNGQRVELGDVENALARLLSGDSDASGTSVAVEVWESAPGHKMLIAILAVGERPDAHDHVRKLSTWLRQRLMAVLPRHMQPSGYIPMVNLPITVAGKLDRRTLKTHIASFGLAAIRALSAANSESEEAAPRTGDERLLARLWAEVLGKSDNELTRNDNFFTLGGDSLSAMRLVAKTREHGFELTTKDLFAQPTLASVAACLKPYSRSERSFASEGEKLEEQVGKEEEQERQLVLDVFRQKYPAFLSTQVELDAKDCVAPCTPTQEIMMNADRVVSFLFSVDDTFDLPRFQAAVERCAARFPIWRTRIVSMSETLYQIILPGNPQWRFTKSTLQEALHEEAKMPIGLGDALTRFVVVGGGTHLIWTQHHATYDAWTLRILLEHVARAYLDPSYYPTPSTLSFHTFATRLHRLFRSAASARSNFWASYFANSTPTPQLFNYAAVQDPRLDNTASFRTRINPQILHAASTPAVTITAAWILATARLTHSRDITIGYVVSGRDAALDLFSGLDSTPGPTLNTIPLRVELDAILRNYITDIRHSCPNNHDLDPANAIPAIASLVQAQLLRITPHHHLDGLPAIRTSSPTAAATLSSLPLSLVVHQGSQRDRVLGPMAGLGLRLEDARPTAVPPRGGFSVEATVLGGGEVEMSAFWDGRAIVGGKGEVERIFELVREGLEE
ncbi:amino acid adenylation [Periconia macrospinosa]|uniref:Amino acid adenylation n=1 Tax=Periconia macrospinosa TaxID=97972 RepID=A0A2V1D3W8_9PLEO|nr:amino acid adenylation [Periconia macrospinosa]